MLLKKIASIFSKKETMDFPLESRLMASHMNHASTSNLDRCLAIKKHAPESQISRL